MENTVELLGYYGSDEVIACSAWTSTSRDLTEEKRQRIPDLINMLWMNGHETPFEKGLVHFLVDTDIATHIHLLKHRISSLNAESARYKELQEDKYYLPLDWDKSNDVMISTGKFWLEKLEEHTKISNELYHSCLQDMVPILGRKRAKESARFFKTYNSQLQSDISFNMRSFANFQKLRNSEHAQKEVRDVARKMLELVESLPDNPFEHTLKVQKERVLQKNF